MRATIETIQVSRGPSFCTDKDLHKQTVARIGYTQITVKTSQLFKLAISHFYQHAQHLNIDVNKNIDQIMKHFSLTIIASVEPDMPWSRDRLDKLESGLMERLMTMESHGGINLRIERRRGSGN